MLTVQILAINYENIFILSKVKVNTHLFLFHATKERLKTCYINNEITGVGVCHLVTLC